MARWGAITAIRLNIFGMSVLSLTFCSFVYTIGRGGSIESFLAVSTSV
jgi:hypothetical protein